MSYRPFVARKFGVEMEMTEVDIDGNGIDEDEIKEALRSAVGRRRVNDQQASYYHSDGGTWDVKTDSSCAVGYGNGWEVAAPALELDDTAKNGELRKACEALTGLRPKINRKCGLHVHVDCSDFSWRDLQHLMVIWSRYEPFFFSVCPTSRRDNDNYCQPWRASRPWSRWSSQWASEVQPALSSSLSEREFQRLAADINRDSSLNITGWWRHGRVEFRLGAGTVNYEKIRRWVQLLLSLVQRAKAPAYLNLDTVRPEHYSGRPLTAKFMFKTLGIAASDKVPASEVAVESKELLAWVEARVERFKEVNPNAPVRPSQIASQAAAGAPVRPFQIASQAAAAGARDDLLFQGIDRAINWTPSDRF